MTSAGDRGYYHPVGAAEAGTETGASEILTVTAKSNAFDETAGEFYPSVEKITVTYYIQCSYKLLNTQWILNYDPEYLELIDEDEINYYIDDGDIEGYMMPFAGGDGVYNLSYRGKVVANTSSTNGYNISARCGYVSATFKPLKAGKTEVYLDTQVFTLKSSEPLSFSCSYGMKVETVESGEYRLARIRNIPSALLGTSFTLSVGSTGSIAYSPMNYCKKVLSGGSDDEALQNTVKALYFYYEAANSYFG